MISAKDELILNSLRQNSRKTIKEISAETGIPAATVFDRFKKLVSDKVIQSFTIRLDHEKTGKNTLAFVMVKFTSRGNIPQIEVTKNICKLSAIEEAHIISGEWDILLKVRTASVRELGELVVEKIRMIDGVQETTTCACFKTVKE